ncbi:hypothetical protein PV327_001760 [Microctonus hyperodae]|uniref:Aminopeptidase n=1 Tax=Microctonus hyperodae TaxID=165561 RepID=A0AA39KNE1_MICHY|nr:hypothetical protein PV327_001760 [Microctonus hyperodae]
MSSVHILLSTILLVSLTQGVPFSSLVKSSAPSPELKDNSSNIYYLPDNIEPISYHINITVDDLGAEKFAFKGRSVITFKPKENIHEIFLHRKNLTIKPGVNLTCGNVTQSLGPTFRQDDMVIFSFSKPMGSNVTCNFAIAYEGQDNGENRGFYRTSYKNKNGKQKWMASTQLEPIAARQIFPCWDEPAFKATFKISIKHNKKYTALSNMPAVASVIDETNSTMMTTYFAESPKMSTYLVAFAIGEFVSVDQDDQNFQVFTRKDVFNEGEYALNIGPGILKALENYTQYSYEKHNLTKMASLAVPKLSAGAMENWGLVIYTEKEFLYTENVSSTLQKENVVGIIAHELAHQWFGNLVTAKWWNDIWLNEGFANYFQYFITNQIKPEWRMMDRFVTNNLQRVAFVADGKNNSHAMSQNRTTSEEIINAFDNITYSKSGSVLRMISHVVGEKKFQTALQDYIKNNAFNSVNNTNLFNELVKVDKGNKHLMKALENWVTVPGYPVITVKINGTEATITQSRFVDRNETVPDDKYWIPLNYYTENSLNSTDTNVSHWFDPTTNITKITLPESKFVIFNKQQFGYYRVNYDEKNWDEIIKYLRYKNYSNIHVLNRAQLIDDSMNLARVGNLSYNIALYLIGYLEKDTDYIPWSAAWRGIEYIHKFVANTEFASTFQNYVLEISKRLVKEALAVKSNETDHIRNLNRMSALSWACKMGSSSCRSEATEKLVKWLDNPEENPFSPDDAEWIICAGVRNANLTTWNKLREKYNLENDTNVFTSLGCTSDTKILNGYLNEILKQNKTKILPSLFKAISDGSDEGINVVFDFMIQEYEKLNKSGDYGLNQWKSDITSLARRLTNEAQHNKLKEFIEKRKEELKGAADEALGIVKANLEINKKRLEQFKVYFTKDTSPPDNSANGFTLTTICHLVVAIGAAITEETYPKRDLDPEILGQDGYYR